jgi:hypothetical protein
MFLPLDSFGVHRAVEDAYAAAVASERGGHYRWQGFARCSSILRFEHVAARLTRAQISKMLQKLI